MLRTWLPRLILILMPILIYLVWHRWFVKAEKRLEKHPWGWLLGAGMLLAALSLLAGGLFQPKNLHKVYVPGEAGPDGKIAPGKFKTPPR